MDLPNCFGPFHSCTNFGLVNVVKIEKRKSVKLKMEKWNLVKKQTKKQNNVIWKIIEKKTELFY